MGGDTFSRTTGLTQQILTFSDPGNNNWTAAQDINQTASGFRVITKDGGDILLSLDGGTTDHFKFPANLYLTVYVAMGRGHRIAVKRADDGVAFGDVRVEVF